MAKCVMPTEFILLRLAFLGTSWKTSSSSTAPALETLLKVETDEWTPT